MSVKSTHFYLGFAALLLVAGACDTVAPADVEQLVVEGFLETGKPLPPLYLQQTQSLEVAYPGAEASGIVDAQVTVTLEGQPIAYRPDPQQVGRYIPEREQIVPAGAAYALDVAWQDVIAAAAGRVPPPITIDSFRVSVPEAPIQAIFLDSLDQITNDLEVQGYIYAIEVELWWRTTFAEVDADSAYWVQTQLRPTDELSSTVLDLFLLNTEILREREVAPDNTGQRIWAGVYAIRVDGESSPLPAHDLTISLLRSDEAYARFVSSSDTPERREPVSNIDGGIGIFSAISLDSVQLRVAPE